MGLMVLLFLAGGLALAFSVDTESTGTGGGESL